MSARRGLPTDRRMRHAEEHYVDAIFSRDESLIFQDDQVIGRMLPLAKLFPNPDQPRKDMGDVESLADSIREQGVLEPILVNKQDEGYMIISGERRFHASTRVGLELVPCVIKNLDQNQILEIALVENLQRKDLDPFEEADGLKMLLKNFNYTHDHIAKKISKSRTSVTETLTLATIPDEVRLAAREASVTAKSMLLGVARLESVEEQLNLIRRIATGAGREEVRRAAKKQEKATPFVFRWRDPKRTVSFDIKFKKSEVEKAELIGVLEGVLAQLKSEAEAELAP